MKNFTPGRPYATVFSPNKLIGLFPRLLLLLSMLFMICTANAQMQVQGRFLYNKCGEKVIIRGIEHMLYYHDQNHAMLPEIGKTGANSIRVMLDPALPASTLRQILQKCVNEKMYISVAPWRGQDIWFRSDIKTVLLEFEDYIILHVFGEAPYESTNNDARWISDATSIITRIRNAGYKAPMDIQSTTYGRDPRPVIRNGQTVMNADPLRNILFGVQMYWGDYYTGIYGMTIAQACARFATLNYPVQVGACPSDCNTACGNLAWDEAYKNQLGCMWWSWTGDEFELSSNGNYNSLTSAGQYIVNNSAYSMKKTSVRSIPCTGGGGDVTAPSVPTGLTSSLITQTSFRLSWAASTDNIAVTGYEIFRNGTSIGTSATTSFNVTGLTAGTTHSMRVRARDAVPNWSAQSTALSVTTASPATVNLALRRPAFSSSNETAALGPLNAVDGSTTTRWSSLFSNPQWIYVDLGATYTFNRVVLRWEAAFGRGYQIQTSNNATTWTNVFTTTTGNGAVDDLAISGTGRYVRMYGTVRGTSWGYSLFEFEVYGTGASARNSLDNELVIKPASTGSFAEGASLTDRVSVYANPVNSGNLRIQVYSDKQDVVRLGLTTNTSQPVLEVQRTVTKGLNTISLPVNPSAAGLYFLIVRQGNEQVAKKVIINK